MLGEKMLNGDEAFKKLIRENEKVAAQRAKTRARAARWDLDVAVFLFAVLIIVIILLFQGAGLEVVAPIAIVGLALVWMVGWRREKELYKVFYKEELSKVMLNLNRSVDETIDEKVKKAFMERW